MRVLPNGDLLYMQQCSISDTDQHSLISTPNPLIEARNHLTKQYSVYIALHRVLKASPLKCLFKIGDRNSAHLAYVVVVNLGEERSVVLECVANVDHVHSFLLYLHNHVDVGLDRNRMDDGLVVCRRDGGGA